MIHWLKDLRTSASLTQEQIASNIEISRVYYTNIENGKRIPRPKIAKQLGNLLNFDWRRFYDNE